MSLPHNQRRGVAQASCPKHIFSIFGSFLAPWHRTAGQVYLPSVVVISLGELVSWEYLYAKKNPFLSDFKNCLVSQIVALKRLKSCKIDKKKKHCQRNLIG